MMRLAAGLGFIVLLFLPGPAQSGHWPALELRLPVEALLLAAAAALPGLFGRRLPVPARAVLALFTLLLALIGLSAVEAPALMGRDLDFSADLGHAGSVVSLFRAAADPLQIALAALAAILVPAVLFILTMLALGAIERGMAGSWLRAALLLGATALAVALSGSGLVSDKALAALDKQGGKLADAWRAGH